MRLTRSLPLKRVSPKFVPRRCGPPVSRDKASWSPEPVVHITSRRQAVRTAAVTTVKVYSNAKSLKLTLNGVEIPTGRSEGVIHLWKDLTLKNGANVVEVTAECEGKPVSDRVTWTFEEE